MPDLMRRAGTGFAAYAIPISPANSECLHPRRIIPIEGELKLCRSIPGCQANLPAIGDGRATLLHGHRWDSIPTTLLGRSREVGDRLSVVLLPENCFVNWE